MQRPNVLRTLRLQSFCLTLMKTQCVSEGWVLQDALWILPMVRDPLYYCQRCVPDLWALTICEGAEVQQTPSLYFTKDLTWAKPRNKDSNHVTSVQGQHYAAVYFWIGKEKLHHNISNLYGILNSARRTLWQNDEAVIICPSTNNNSLLYCLPTSWLSLMAASVKDCLSLSKVLLWCSSSAQHSCRRSHSSKK